MDEIVFESVKVARLEAGDILVVKVDGTLSKSRVYEINKIIKGIIPLNLKDKVKILIADKNIDLQIIKGKEKL
jgi:hypothetical protein